MNRQYYKKFDGFGLRILPMRRGKIERETKREKIDFHLEGMQGGERKLVLPPSEGHKESVWEKRKIREIFL